MSPKTVVVFTATGSQGGSVARYMRQAGWNVVGISRTPESEAAKALKDIGVQMVKGDLNDVNSYKEYFKGVDAAYINADYWTIFMSNGFDSKAAAATEIMQDQNAIQAAHDAGVPHIVFSTLDGGYGVVHSDSKAEVTKWAAKSNIPITNFYMTIYWSIFTKMNLITPKDDETFTLSLPIRDTDTIPGIAVEQIGAWIRIVLADPEEWRGKDIQAAAERISVEMAKALTELSGKVVKTLGTDEESFNDPALKAKLGEDIWLNWKLFHDGLPHRDIPASRKLVPEAWTWREWAQQSPEMKELLRF